MTNIRGARLMSKFKGPLAYLLTLVISVIALQACGDSHEGKPTGAVCPAAPTLTYANFGKNFVDTYCQRCHGESVTGAARNGAPADHSFDTLVDIQVLGEHMDERAGAGPNAINRAMPPSAPTPTDDQRRQFSEWIACGAL